ncbi:hypothetical protein K437DRAFT_284588 [Tilletiaria anomala UBC 951]|uniref:Uncharacterized protein n=1 Tax=Tilletiaria anomala (strain ATCC 24038 / CBS 436.72 / UBC 951) TaxID=1037660 RepID=A0A066WL48_TILAU|nr:uncharacterized protein K437DRAFT_284588 [Tilletiaria anomala UBC 951]KDN53303.1 hypothetical protein K437DRAFT_284588 [Tilletiaria anomala UBC 951]
MNVNDKPSSTELRTPSPLKALLSPPRSRTLPSSSSPNGRTMKAVPKGDYGLIRVKSNNGNVVDIYLKKALETVPPQRTSSYLDMARSVNSRGRAAVTPVPSEICSAPCKVCFIMRAMAIRTSIAVAPSELVVRDHQIVHLGTSSAFVKTVAPIASTARFLSKGLCPSFSRAKSTVDSRSAHDTATAPHAFSFRPYGLPAELTPDNSVESKGKWLSKVKTGLWACTSESTLQGVVVATQLALST